MNQETTHRRDLLIGLAVFLAALGLYISTLAPGIVFGDPSEYTFVPHIWGVAHPPGYAFQTVLGGLWQRIIPVGDIPYRANLLSAVAGAGIAALAYGSVRALTAAEAPQLPAIGAALLAGLSAAAATDIWQHSIHANAHIITALLATLSVFLLLTWSRDPDNRRWLFAFCIVAGVSVTHHPLLVFSFPAYTVFIIATQPGVVLGEGALAAFKGEISPVEALGQPVGWINWRTPLIMLGFALIGLAIWLYFPLRSTVGQTPFGPDNLNTLNGFLDLALARGLRVNLFHFGWADQADRLLVFWSLLRLQIHSLLIPLMAIGWGWLWLRRWRVAWLVTLLLIFNVGFIINTIQDVMAYLMVPFALLMILTGLGLLALIELATRNAEAAQRVPPLALSAAVLALLLFPLIRIVSWAPVVSLRDYRAASDWVEEVYREFEGQGDNALLLAHWEHLTPLWVEQHVYDNPLDEKDLRLVFVAANSPTPWLDNVARYQDDGPLFVSGYQPELVAVGMRLRPVSAHIYEVLPAGTADHLDYPTQIDQSAGPVTLLSANLAEGSYRPGERVPLSLALRLDQPTDQVIFPQIRAGGLSLTPSTDSHLLTPNWELGEVIAERFDFTAPLGDHCEPLLVEIGLRNLSNNEDLSFEDNRQWIEIGSVEIDCSIPPEPLPDELLTIYGNQIGLVGAAASGNGQRREAVWSDPIVLGPGYSLDLRLTWRALSSPVDNYKLFVHLIDPGFQVVAQHDAPPMTGAFPTFLWFPKWLPGQQIVEPITLTVPPDAPPGDYQIAIGMYGFNTFRRVHTHNPAGEITGDFFILGSVRVE
ncbi:MAG: DUF2723 domain-containing protein [Chloroflexi bacterium]|nr:DUF2723 domain-containing protein [Chloroflexota bacterium]